MIDLTSHILAVIPARGGSKGIPNKNIYPLEGQPLLAYTIHSLASCNTPLIVAISTDSQEIAEVARSTNSSVIIIKRPQEIASDTASTESVLLHAATYLECASNLRFDSIMTAQPTSPFRTAQTIDSFIADFEKSRKNFDAMLTLSSDYADFWVKTNSNFERLFPDAPRRRQDRSPLYSENSCLYITDYAALHQTGSILGKNTKGYIIDATEGIDINTMQDIYLAQAVITQNKA